MGRLAHLKKSLPLMAREFSRVVVIDWNCPDRTWEWISREHGAGRLHNVWPMDTQTLDAGRFHKTRALNKGAAYAASWGATRFAFIDADTLVQPGLRAQLEALGPEQIALTGPRVALRSSLVGFLSVTRGRFGSVQGYDERYIGWGYEDQDMRLRLIADAACEPVWLSEDYFDTIEHPHALRSSFQPDTIEDSNKRNRDLFRAALRPRLELWTKELSDACPYR